MPWLYPAWLLRSAHALPSRSRLPASDVHDIFLSLVETLNASKLLKAALWASGAKESRRTLSEARKAGHDRR
jgi:hypothetical protein